MTTVNVLKQTKVPGLPSVQSITDPAARAWAQAVTELLNVREHVIPGCDLLDKNVTFRDMYRNGMLNVSIDGKPYLRSLDARGSPLYLSLPAAKDVSTDYIAPPAVTGLAASAALNSIIVTFDAPSYHNHAYTEIWRAAANDIGLAVRVGTTAASVYADPVGLTNSTYYYWARNVSQANVPGPFNATAGTPVTSGLVQNSNLADLVITASKIASGAINAYSMFGTGLRPVGIGAALPTLPDANYPVASGFFLTTDQKLYRVDALGSAWTKAVDGADLVANSVTAGAIAAGTITTTQIAAGTIVGGNIAAGTIVASNIAAGTITGDRIAAATIAGSNIVASTITGSLIAASTITASNLSVTQLSAISANIGTATAGKIQNSGGTNYVDLNATGVSTFIAAGTAFKVDASGNVSIASGTTGARLTIANNVIKVYDSLGTLRVKIGDLTA